MTDDPIQEHALKFNVAMILHEERQIRGWARRFIDQGHRPEELQAVYGPWGFARRRNLLRVEVRDTKGALTLWARRKWWKLTGNPYRKLLESEQ